MEKPQPQPASCKIAAGIKIGRTTTLAQENGKQIETPIYTMTLGKETVELLPFKNWTQIDVHKWVVQGKLPASPAGLEVTLDHVKIAGETVRSNDPEGCEKLEKAFDEWLALERSTLELARKKIYSKPTPAVPDAAKRPEPQPLHYKVQVDHEHQVHIHCLQGKEVLATIGLNVPGFNSLADQGLLRKPRTLKIGALHDWIELDGVVYRFEKGQDDAVKLEHILNERYLSNLALGHGKDVVVYANAASSTGFDIQFTASLGGVPDNRRRPLNEDTLDLLQDPKRCGLLPDGLVIKLTRPTLIFKQKTADGGERNLEKTPENCVVIKGDNGSEKLIDLSQPVSYLRLSAVELTAVFNHPSINKHGKVASPATAPQSPSASVTERVVGAKSGPEQATTTDSTGAALTIIAHPGSPPKMDPPVVQLAEVQPETLSSSKPVPEVPTAKAQDSGLLSPTAEEMFPERSQSNRPIAEPNTQMLPNLWLKPVLAQPPIRFDWLSCLLYDELAEHFGNSNQGQLGPMSCWSVALSETEDIAESTFKGVFLTEKRGLGFLNRGQMIRFYKGVVFIGTEESALEGIGIELVGVGIDAEQRIVFIVLDDYWDKFDVPERMLKEELSRLSNNGSQMMTAAEALNSLVPLEVVWTAPADQENPVDPQPQISIAPLGTIAL